MSNQYAPRNGIGWVAIPVAIGESDPRATGPDATPRFKSAEDATAFFASAKSYLLIGTFCGSRHFVPAPGMASLFAVSTDAALSSATLASANSIPSWRTLAEAIEELGQVDDAVLAAHRSRRPEYVGVGVGGPGRIVGRLRDSRGGVLPGASVEAWPRGGGTRVTSNSHADGSYEIDNLPAGWYRVIARLVGFVTSVHEYVWVDGRRTLDAMLPVAGFCECITGGIPEKATLEVRVTDPFGRPWSDTTVTLDDERRGVWPTSTDGRIVLGQLEPGSYIVRVAAAGFAVTTRPVRLRARSTERLNVQLEPSGRELVTAISPETTRRFRVETNLGEILVDFGAAASDTMRSFVRDVVAGVFDSRILAAEDDKQIFLNHTGHFGRTWTWQVESTAITFATTATPADRIVGQVVDGTDVAANVRRLQVPEAPLYSRRVAILAIVPFR